MASASPSARAAVVLAVGARFSGQASASTAQSRCTSATCASVDPGVPVRPIRPAPSRLTISARRTTSGVSPPYDRATTTSSAGDGAEVAVQGLGGMQEERRRARAREGRGDLPADQARLAHAGHDDTAPTAGQQRHGLLEACVEPLDEPVDGSRLGAQDAGGEFERRGTRTGVASLIDGHVFTPAPPHGRARDAARRPASRSRRRAFSASDFARDGSSWTSRNTPSTPAATPARARVSM